MAEKLRVGRFSFVPTFTCSIAHNNNRFPPVSFFFNQKLTLIQNLRIYSAISVMSIYTQSFMVKITTSSAAHECWFYINFLQLKIKKKTVKHMLVTITIIGYPYTFIDRNSTQNHNSWTADVVAISYHRHYKLLFYKFYVIISCNQK